MSNLKNMTPDFQEQSDFSEQEIAEMATVLVGKFGVQAINIAAFFLDEHLELQDHPRAESWLRVMTYLDQQHDQSIAECRLH